MTPAWRQAWVGLGSNLDQPAERVREAAQRLGEIAGVRALVLSPLYSTPPWGKRDQPSFVNAVAGLQTVSSAHDLLQQLLTIERAMGRERRERWGPRRIDLDLLHIDGERVEDAQLHLPHPRLGERAFVLLPWATLAPDTQVPGFGRIGDLLLAVDCSGIQPLP